MVCAAASPPHTPQKQFSDRYLVMHSFVVSKWDYFSVLVLIIGAAWIWISKAPPGSTTDGQIPQPHQGFHAPDFTLSTKDGENITLSSLRGQPVLVNLWASWCPPCRAEMPAMQRLYTDYHVVIGGPISEALLRIRVDQLLGE